MKLNPALGLRLAHWAWPMFRPRRFKFLYGGRGSAKTWTLFIVALMIGSRRKTSFLCLREVQESLADSAHQVICDLIEADPAFRKFYTPTKTTIYGKNGTRFRFQGLSEIRGTARRVRGREGVDVAILDEAQYITKESFEDLEPTIRKDGSEIWAALNPRFETDVMYEIAMTAGEDPDVWALNVNWQDNPFWNEAQEKARKRFERAEPDRYPHIYGGQLDTLGLGLRQVLSYALVRECMDAWFPKAAEGGVQVGFDVADEGRDHCCVVARKGPVVIAIDRWSGKGKTIGYSTRKAVEFALEHFATHFYYDAGGLGAGVRDHVTDVPFEVEGIHFNGEVGGKKRMYLPGRSNGDTFKDRGMQMAWNLRMRADRTRERLAGEPGINAEDCLFLDPDLPFVTDFLAELTRPTWDDSSGKKRLKKKQPKERSPDRWDATELAFAGDSKYGLSHGVPASSFATIYG